jgi:hypothetical protein
VVLAGCGDDDEASEGTTSTTMESSTTTSTAPPSSTTNGGEATLPEEPPIREDAVSGSGCTPGPGELPSGWWYGTIDGAPDGTLRFDLACYYVGAAAEEEATTRGDEVNNDYYVVNDNAQVRTVAVADDATASCVQLGAGVESTPCEPNEVAGDWAVWIRVQDGEVDRIIEQYAP